MPNMNTSVEFGLQVKVVNLTFVNMYILGQNEGGVRVIVEQNRPTGPISINEGLERYGGGGPLYTYH